MKIFGIPLPHLPHYLDCTRKYYRLERKGKPQDQIDHQNTTTILLLPGFLRGDPVLRDLGNALFCSGYDVYYPNIKKSDWKHKDGVEHILGKIESKIEQIPDHKPLIILGHSTGGVIAMRLLGMSISRKLYHIIQVGSPNAGSSLFDLKALDANPIAQMMRAGRQFDGIHTRDVPPTLSLVLQDDYMVLPPNQSGIHIGIPDNHTLHIPGGHHDPLVDPRTIERIIEHIRQFHGSLSPGHYPQ